MSELYLIAHKVRGEPAFDIAERMPELDEDGCEAWIIPTSGHRAHPYAYQKIGEGFTELNISCDFEQPMPDSWPDHYPTAAEPRRSPTAGRGLLARLGLLRRATIKRRI